MPSLARSSLFLIRSLCRVWERGSKCGIGDVEAGGFCLWRIINDMFVEKKCGRLYGKTNVSVAKSGPKRFFVWRKGASRRRSVAVLVVISFMWGEKNICRGIRVRVFADTTLILQNHVAHFRVVTSARARKSERYVIQTPFPWDVRLSIGLAETRNHTADSTSILLRRFTVAVRAFSPSPLSLCLSLKKGRLSNKLLSCLPFSMRTFCKAASLRCNTRPTTFRESFLLFKVKGGRT